MTRDDFETVRETIRHAAVSAVGSPEAAMAALMRVELRLAATVDELAALRGERDRLAGTRDALLRERLATANAVLEEAIGTAWSARTSRRSPEKLEFVNVAALAGLRALLARADQEAE